MEVVIYSNPRDVSHETALLLITALRARQQYAVVRNSRAFGSNDVEHNFDIAIVGESEHNPVDIAEEYLNAGIFACTLTETELVSELFENPLPVDEESIDASLEILVSTSEAAVPTPKEEVEGLPGVDADTAHGLDGLPVTSESTEDSGETTEDSGETTEIEEPTVGEDALDTEPKTGRGKKGK